MRLFILKVYLVFLYFKFLKFKLVNFRVFLIIGSYIHGTRGFANQIYINHRIGSSLESNKQETFEQILDWPMKKLLLSMGNILPNNCKNIHYKSIEFCKIPFLHQALLKDNGYDILDSTLIQISNLITIKDSCNNIFLIYQITCFYFLNFIKIKVFSTTTYDQTKLDNNHTVILINGDIGIIEQFYKFDSEIYAVIQFLKQTPYNFTIAQATPDLALALLKINESIFFVPQ